MSITQTKQNSKLKSLIHKNSNAYLLTIVNFCGLCHIEVTNNNQLGVKLLLEIIIFFIDLWIYMNNESIIW